VDRVLSCTKRAAIPILSPQSSPSAGNIASDGISPPLQSMWARLSCQIQTQDQFVAQYFREEGHNRNQRYSRMAQKFSNKLKNIVGHLPIIIICSELIRKFSIHILPLP